MPLFCYFDIYIYCFLNLHFTQGDLILEVPHTIEALTKAIDITNNPNILKIVNTES